MAEKGRGEISGRVDTDCGPARTPGGGGGSRQVRRASLSPLCCMMTARTSLDCDRFPKTRVASSTASILALSSSFIITGVGERGGEGGGSEEGHRRIRQRRPGALTLGHCESAPAQSRTLRLVEGQVVDGGGGVHHQLLALPHGPQG